MYVFWNYPFSPSRLTQCIASMHNQCIRATCTDELIPVQLLFLRPMKHLLTFNVANISSHLSVPCRSMARGEQETQHLERNPSLRARVSRSVLEGGNTGPFRRRFLSRLARRLRPTPAVKVEQLEHGLAPLVLYAPALAVEGETYAKTMLVSDQPTVDEAALVYSDLPFEVRAVGMFVKSFDRFSCDNELLLYSIQTDPNAPCDVQSLPFIHFDFSNDATTTTDKPNTFLPIPASKSFVMGSSGKQNKLPSSAITSPTCVEPLTCASLTSGERRKVSKPKHRRSVNVQFRILEIDQPSQTIQDAVSGIKDLGGMVSGFGTAVPFLGALNPALSIVSNLSRRALDSYAMPDKVINIDMDFMLANRKRVESGTAPPGEYLRFGYYFFLSEPVEGKLYASVRTPGNLTLMLKRSDDENRPGNCSVQARTYFPLTEVSYLVVRVGEPSDTKRSKRRPVQMNHARLLEDLFRRAQPGEDEPVNVRNSLYELGLALGVFDSDDDDSCSD